MMRKWLRDARKNRKLTLKEVGTKLGITESYYCAIENGERQKRMELGLASKLAEILGMSVEDIVRLEAEMQD